MGIIVSAKKALKRGLIFFFVSSYFIYIFSGADLVQPEFINTTFIVFCEFYEHGGHARTSQDRLYKPVV